MHSGDPVVRIVLWVVFIAMLVFFTICLIPPRVNAEIKEGTIHYKIYRTCIEYIIKGDTLYAKNVKCPPKKKKAINKPPPFRKHPNVSVPKRGSSMDMTRGYQ